MLDSLLHSAYRVKHYLSERMLSMVEDDAKKEAGRQGGLRRAEALSDEQKKDIAQRAALARWGAKATHRGNFKEQFGIDVDCYVLDDATKTAVISQRGMGAALGMGVSGSRLPRFVNSKLMAEYVGPELREKLEKPLVFQASGRGPNFPGQAKVFGYDVTILIDVCKAVVSAEADGKAVNPSVTKQAHIILSASAKAGIKGLVYALAGYDPTRQEVIEAFKYYVREEAREYEKEFPPQLYAEWYRLYELQKPVRGRPWKAKHLTIDHIYHPVARSSGKVYELAKALRNASGDPGSKVHQFLSEVGVKALRMQLGQTLGIAQISDTKEQYEANIERAFGVQRDLFRQ
jgi:hypothetical protein